MPGLQSIDVALFRFINGTLQNPLFDAVMPVFAGHALFYPLVLVLSAFLLWKGGA